MEPISIHLRADGIAVVHAPAMLDKDTAPVLRRALVTLTQGPPLPAIVVACGAVEFADSMGLGVLLGGLKRAKGADGRLVLAAVNERLAKVLRVTGLAKQFEVYPTAPDAVEAFAGSRPGGR